MSFNRRGVGFGLATAIGFPFALVVFLANSGELIGFESAKDWLHPVLSGPGFLLAGIGLFGLYKRLNSNSYSKTSTIRAVWLGVALGLAGIADISFTGGEAFGWFAVAAAFVSLTFGLATMGRVALRDKTFGVLSFVPLAVAVSAGVWFLSLPRQLTGGFHGTAQMYALVVHVALWFILGAVLGADPPRDTDSVRAAEEKTRIK